MSTSNRTEHRHLKRTLEQFSTCPGLLDSTMLPAEIKALLELESSQARYEALTQMHQSMGFEWLSVADVVFKGNALTAFTIFNTHEANHWEQVYLDKRYHLVDPRPPWINTTHLPCVWDIASLRSTTTASPALLHEFITDMECNRVRSGVMMGLPCGKPGHFRFISFMSPHKGCTWIDAGIMGQLTLFAPCIAEWAPQFMQSAVVTTSDIKLSAIHRTILEYLVQGVSDKVIADKMNISPHNLDYHMRKLRERFGVNNRGALVYAAMSRDDEWQGTSTTW